MPGTKKKIDAKGLWQTFYSDLGVEPDKDISGKVGVSPVMENSQPPPPPPTDPRAAAALFSVEDDSDQELENVPFIVNHTAMGEDGTPGKKTMVVVSEKELDASRKFIFRPKSELDDDQKYTRSMESIDLNNDHPPPVSNGSSLGNRFRIRRESDLELALPATASRRLMNKYCYPCIRCYNHPIWNTYVTYIALGAVMLALYLIIVIAIWKGLGG